MRKILYTFVFISIVSFTQNLMAGNEPPQDRNIDDPDLNAIIKSKGISGGETPGWKDYGRDVSNRKHLPEGYSFEDDAVPEQIYRKSYHDRQVKQHIKIGIILTILLIGIFIIGREMKKVNKGLQQKKELNKDLNKTIQVEENIKKQEEVAVEKATNTYNKRPYISEFDIDMKLKHFEFKQKMIKATESAILENLKNQCKENPMMNTPFEGLIIQSILNKSTETCREVLISMKSISNLSDEDIDEILTCAYNNIHNNLFD